MSQPAPDLPDFDDGPAQPVFKLDDRQLALILAFKARDGRQEYVGGTYCYDRMIALAWIFERYLTTGEYQAGSGV